MKKPVSHIVVCVMVFLALACSEVERDFPEVVSTSPLPGHFAGLEFYMDTTQRNRFNPDSFCHDWEFVSTRIEEWVDGSLKETRCLPRIWREHGIMHTIS